MLPTDLLFEFLSAEPLPAIARRRGLSFSQLLAWLDSPEIQRELTSLDTLALRRARLIAACAHTTCTAALERIAITNADPLESRRAATGALRAIKPARAPGPPRTAPEPRPGASAPDGQRTPPPAPRPAPALAARATRAPDRTPARCAPLPVTPTPLETLLGAPADPFEPLSRPTTAAAILHANGRAPPPTSRRGRPN